MIYSYQTPSFFISILSSVLPLLLFSAENIHTLPCLYISTQFCLLPFHVACFLFLDSLKFSLLELCFWNTHDFFLKREKGKYKWENTTSFNTITQRLTKLTCCCAFSSYFLMCAYFYFLKMIKSGNSMVVQ